MIRGVHVRHNIEVAHRLMNLPGKCQAIHGHSMTVEIELQGEVNENGILEGLDFGTIKRDFRAMLDEKFDHHLVLNHEDPFFTLLWDSDLPGLIAVPGDPTVENLSMWIFQSCKTAYDWGHFLVAVSIQETSTNGAFAIEE